MRARGDLDCFHEPFMYYYYLHLKRRAFPHFDADPAKPRTYEGVKATLLEAAEAGPVFFKDMSYYIFPLLTEDAAFADRLRHSFLIRDPLFSLVSYHGLDADFTSEEAGLELQWRHFDWLRCRSGESPPVIQAESVRADPLGSLRRYCEAVGLPFLEGALDWKANPIPQDWNEVSGWHGKVAATTGIRPVDQSALVVERKEKLSYLRSRPALRAYYDHHLPFYEKLKAFSLF